MIHKRYPVLPESAVTDETVYRQRRQFLSLGAAGALGLAAGSLLSACDSDDAITPATQPLHYRKGSPFNSSESPTPYDDITSYTNYYEFGTSKSGPAKAAANFQTSPWSLQIEGEVARPGNYPLEELLKPHPLEERIYRLRCVEAWSMVIPWVGFPLSALIKRLEPTSRAKFVEFVTLNDPQRMPGQQRDVLTWPYREGLRIDEAMHPLTLIATGLYGKSLPNQNGAPLRLVVPWKYGFKSIKAIVALRFLETPPPTTWSSTNPSEYGFYANVNPAVDHPRWSQNRERRIGDLRKRATLPFNGYADEVAALYSGMDLKHYF